VKLYVMTGNCESVAAEWMLGQCIYIRGLHSPAEDPRRSANVSPVHALR
jgi:hypothetical protein